MQPAGVVDLIDEAGKVGYDVLEAVVGHQVDGFRPADGQIRSCPPQGAQSSFGGA